MVLSPFLKEPFCTNVMRQNDMGWPSKLSNRNVLKPLFLFESVRTQIFYCILSIGNLGYTLYSQQDVYNGVFNLLYKVHNGGPLNGLQTVFEDSKLLAHVFCFS